MAYYQQAILLQHSCVFIFLLQRCENTLPPVVTFVQTELNSSLSIKITQCPSQIKSPKTPIFSCTSFHPNKVTQYLCRKKVPYRLLRLFVQEFNSQHLSKDQTLFLFLWKRSLITVAFICNSHVALFTMPFTEDTAKRKTSGTFVFLPTTTHLPTCITNRSRKEREVKWWRIKKERRERAKQIPSVQIYMRFATGCRGGVFPNSKKKVKLPESSTHAEKMSQKFVFFMHDVG